MVELVVMAIPPETSIPIPFGLHIVIWLEFIMFVPFSFSHYCGAFKPLWMEYTSSAMGKITLWSGEMLNGVGAWVLMYMLGHSLWQQTISVIEIEILFLSHALWYGVLISLNPRGPAFLLSILVNPHTYLYIGVIATGYDLPRPICFAVSAFVLSFGFYRRYYQIPITCFGKESLRMQDHMDAIKLHKDAELLKVADALESSRKCFPFLDDRSPEHSKDGPQGLL